MICNVVYFMHPRADNAHTSSILPTPFAILELDGQDEIGRGSPYPSASYPQRSIRSVVSQETQASVMETP